MADTESGKGTDPNEERDDERARGKDHQSFVLSEGANKGAPETEPFKITNAG